MTFSSPNRDTKCVNPGCDRWYENRYDNGGYCYPCWKEQHQHVWAAWKSRTQSGKWEVWVGCSSEGCYKRARLKKPHWNLVGDFDQLEVGKDNLDTTPCEHCGNTEGVEYHHYAPKELFGNDCNNWPIGPLCITCHVLWHQTMNRQAARTNIRNIRQEEAS